MESEGKCRANIETVCHYHAVTNLVVCKDHAQRYVGSAEKGMHQARLSCRMPDLELSRRCDNVVSDERDSSACALWSVRHGKAATLAGACEGAIGAAGYKASKSKFGYIGGVCTGRRAPRCDRQHLL